ncbi:MAG: hypothetical protein ACF8NJ_00880 [Phycisphaerales bacterium JB038]
MQRYAHLTIVAALCCAQGAAGQFLVDRREVSSGGIVPPQSEPIWETHIAGGQVWHDGALRQGAIGLHNQTNIAGQSSLDRVFGLG